MTLPTEQGPTKGEVPAAPDARCPGRQPGRILTLTDVPCVDRTSIDGRRRPMMPSTVPNAGASGRRRNARTSDALTKQAATQGSLGMRRARAEH